MKSVLVAVAVLLAATHVYSSTLSQETENDDSSTQGLHERVAALEAQLSGRTVITGRSESDWKVHAEDYVTIAVDITQNGKVQWKDQPEIFTSPVPVDADTAKGSIAWHSKGASCLYFVDDDPQMKAGFRVYVRIDGKTAVDVFKGNVAVKWVAIGETE